MEKKPIIRYSDIDAGSYFGIAKPALLFYIAVDYFSLNAWWIGSFSALITVATLAHIVRQATTTPTDIFEYIDRRIDQKGKNE